MALKKNIVDYIKLGLIVGAVILLDQLTKHLVRSNMAPGEIFPQGHWLVHYVRIIHWHNSGTVGGVFQGMGVVFTALAFIVSGAILYTSGEHIIGAAGFVLAGLTLLRVIVGR